jgi:integrase
MRITDASIKRLENGEETGHDTYQFDDEVRGFFAKRNKGTGNISFGIQYKRDGRNRRYHVGRYPTLSLVSAKKQAKKVAAKVELGEDPATDRQDHRASPTVRELCADFIDDYARPQLKAGTVSKYESLIKLHILPALGSRKVAEIGRSDVARLHKKMKDKPVTANRVVTLLSKLCNYAENLGFRPLNSNPARIPKYKEKPRDRYLNPSELARLGAALKAHEKRHPEVVLLARLLAVTGCRRMEIQNLRWRNVGTDAIHIQDAKTGDREIHLSAPALLLLAEAREGGTSEWVIPGRVKGQAMVNPHKPWRHITKSADLEGLRFHDLRHTLASVAVGEGMSLPIIGAVLGHASQAATARYAHLASDPVKAAAEETAEMVWNSLESSTPSPKNRKM